MKLSPTPRRRQKGFLLALVVIVVAVVIIGYVAYKICKCLKKMPVRTLPPESAELQVMTSNAVAELTLELQAEHPGETVVVQSAALSFVPVFVPFGTNAVPVMIEFSTNLVDWEALAILQAGEKFSDPNIYNRAFYRAFDGNGRSLAPSTNAGFEWMEAHK